MGTGLLAAHKIQVKMKIGPGLCFGPAIDFPLKIHAIPGWKLGMLNGVLIPYGLFLGRLYCNGIRRSWLFVPGAVFQSRIPPRAIIISRIYQGSQIPGNCLLCPGQSVKVFFSSV